MKKKEIDHLYEYDNKIGTDEHTITNEEAKELGVNITQD